MKKRTFLAIISLVILTVLLASCSGERVQRYEGKSDNWKALYFVHQSSDSSEYGEGSIRYTGKEKLKKVKYKVEGEHGTMEGSIDSPEDGNITLNKSCRGCTQQSKDAPYHVTIKWNNQEEEFNLTGSYK